MPKLTIDTTEAKSFEPLPDDQYECQILEVGEVKQGPKAQYVSVTFEVTDGEYSGRRIWRNYTIEGKGVSFFTELWAKATGEALEIGEAGLDVDTDDLVGKPIKVLTEQEEYEETIRPQVKKIYAV
jgi:hypothetical protein